MVECAALEMRFTREGNGGSNPSLSAMLIVKGLREISVPLSTLNLKAQPLVYPTMQQSGLTEDFLNRFGGIARLYGRPALERLARSQVCVVGIGGVGPGWRRDWLAAG